MAIFRMWIAVDPSKWLSKGVGSRMCCFGVGLPYKIQHGEPTSPCGHLRQLPLPNPSLLRAWFYMARRRLCLLGLLQVWLVNGMALLFGCGIRQFSLAINRLGSIPKVENLYPIIKAICYAAIRCEIPKSQAIIWNSNRHTWIGRQHRISKASFDYWIIEWRSQPLLRSIRLCSCHIQFKSDMTSHNRLTELSSGAWFGIGLKMLPYRNTKSYSDR